MINTYCLNFNCPQSKECKRRKGAIKDYSSWAVFNYYVFEGFTICGYFIE